MRVLAVLTCLLLLACCEPAATQTLESILEDLAELEEPDLEEVLRSLIPEPWPINRMPADSIAALSYLNTAQMRALRDLHRRHAPDITLQQLSEALEMPPELVALIFRTDRPFRLDAHASSRSIGQHDGLRQQFRLRLASGAVEAGAVSEKDPGEGKLDDFRAGYLRFDFAGSSILLGNFALQAGNGLVFAGTFGQPSLRAPSRSHAGTTPRLLPYRSVTENAAMQGAAARWHKHGIDVLAFLSRASRDARITPDGLAVSLPNTGIHRTSSELELRNRLRERSGGALLSIMPVEALRLGLAFYHADYSHAILPPDTVRQRFAFRGQSQRVVGANASFRLSDDRVRIAAEAAATQQGRAVMLSVYAREAATTIAAAYWHAEPGFDHPYGALPGAFLGGTANEAGFYLGLGYRSRLGHWTLHGLHRATPWRTFRLPMPSQRQELGLVWEKSLRRGTALMASLRFRRLPQSAAAAATAWQPAGPVLADERFALWRLQLKTRLHRKLHYRLRLDGVRLAPEFAAAVEQGTSQLHELSYRSRSITAGIRYTYFRTDSYASRVYHFESFFPTLLRIQPLYGEGERIFTYLRLHAGKRLRIAIFSGLTSRESEPDRWIGGLEIQI